MDELVPCLSNNQPSVNLVSKSATTREEEGEGRTGRSTRHQNLSNDPQEVHNSKRLCPKVDRPSRAKDERNSGNDERDDKVQESVRQPGDDVECWVGVAR